MASAGAYHANPRQRCAAPRLVPQIPARDDRPADDGPGRALTRGRGAAYYSLNSDHFREDGATMKTLPLAEAKAKLSRLVDRLADTDEEILITRNGRPAAILLSPGEYESWKETVAVRTDRDLAAEIRRGLRDINRRTSIYTHEELLPRR